MHPLPIRYSPFPIFINMIYRCFWVLVLALFQITLPVQKSSATPIEPGLTCSTENPAELPEPPLFQEQPSIPSLWLAAKLFGGDILNKWFVAPEDETLVILIVDRLVWRQMDYLDRYQFVNKFATVARQYGYNTLVCNVISDRPQAAYFCHFDATPLICDLELDL